ncbi:uncharacterized protein BX664DRAFT_238046, partial [Halteromyces radiatus]|uniref:uncharacterized protein n=1 Tax=Halteromyces radiatus TaxID=101107 RepID=UPI002220674F
HDLDSSAMFDENDLDDTFKKDYSQWLETEVYSKKNQWKYGKDNHDDDDDEYLDNYHKQKANTTNWPGTPIPASPICRPLDNAGISPTVLAQEINKLYHEELNREFDMNGSMNGKETKIKDEWDAPTIPTNYMGEFIYTNNNNDDDDLYPGDDDDDDDDYDDDKKSTRWLTDPLVDVNWTTLTEDEFAKRLAIVEEKTVRRWMNVDINDPQYIKVLDTFEKSEESGYDEW